MGRAFLCDAHALRSRRRRPARSHVPRHGRHVGRRQGDRAGAGAQAGPRRRRARRRSSAAVASPRSSATTRPTRRVESIEVDVASQASIAAVRRGLHEALRRSCTCSSTAPALTSRRREKTADGIEITWATNVLGYFLPAVLLLDRLAASAPARIVTVASGVAGGLDLDDVEFEAPTLRGAWPPTGRASRPTACSPGRSRAACGRAASRRTRCTPATCGRTSSADGDRSAFFFRVGAALFGRSPERGAETAVWLASSSALGGRHRRLLRRPQGETLPLPRRGAQEDALWTLVRAHDAMTATWRVARGARLLVAACVHAAAAMCVAGERLRRAGVLRRRALRGARGDAGDRQRATPALRARGRGYGRARGRRPRARGGRHARAGGDGAIASSCASRCRCPRRRACSRRTSCSSASRASTPTQRPSRCTPRAS